MVASLFRIEVISIVRNIPKGRLMTYGQIAALAGSPRAARIVGGIAHFGDDNIPWHRVVNKKGGLASGYPGGRLAHQKALEEEGIEIVNYKVKDMNKMIWWPEG